MLWPASRAAHRSSVAARRALLPLAFALATVLAQLLLPLAHLEERRQAAHEAGALECAGAGPDLEHLHAGSPGEALPHDARRCVACAAAAQARSTLADAAPPAIVAPVAGALRLAVSRSCARAAEAPERCASPRAPPVPRLAA